MPRYQGCFHKGSFDRQLGKLKIVGWDKRPLVKPSVRFLRNVLDQATQWNTVWKESLSERSVEIVEDAIATGERYLFDAYAVALILAYEVEPSGNYQTRAQNLLDMAGIPSPHRMSCSLSKHKNNTTTNKTNKQNTTKQHSRVQVVIQ